MDKIMNKLGMFSNHTIEIFNYNMYIIIYKRAYIIFYGLRTKKL